MIVKLDNKKTKVSKEIHSIFQASYKIEAILLQVTTFPPLKRKLSELCTSINSFYGYFLNNELSAVIEIDNNSISTHIQSLAVHPKHFRKGIAKQLIQFILDYYKSEIFTVETGLRNKPAIDLYTSFNFKESKQFDTNHGVRKIRLNKFIN